MYNYSFSKFTKWNKKVFNQRGISNQFFSQYSVICTVGCKRASVAKVLERSVSKC